MGSDEVYATIGKPTSEDRYMTGKGFIPFNFGGDKHRMAAHYKGIGIITLFERRFLHVRHERVLSVDYDPDEPGFVKKSSGTGARSSQLRSGVVMAVVTNAMTTSTL